MLGETDVLYVPRVQKERFADEKELEKVKDVYRVVHAALPPAKEDVIVMHPLPRLNGKLRFFRIDPIVLQVQKSVPRSTLTFDSRRAVPFVRCVMDLT